MSENQLQIVISVINNAAGQLAEVGTQLSALAGETAADAADMSASMAGAATSIEDSLTTAEQAVVAAAEAALTQWDGAATGMEDAMSGAASAMQDEYAGMGNSAELAAAGASEAWQTSLAELQSTMAQTEAQIDADFAGMAETGTATGAKLESSISSLGGKMMMTGVMAGVGGGLLTGAVESMADAAGKTDDAFDQLGNTVKNAFASAGTPTAGYATTVADLTAKIDTQKAAIASADAAAQKWTGTTAEVAASHEKAAASAETAQVNLAKLQQQLDQVTASQQLVGGSAADTTAQFEAAARANTNLGFTVGDSATALQLLFASTGNVNETMGAYQDAMDLSAAKGIDLATASNAVIQAMSGQGRALRDLGINVADGLSGQTALAAIQDKVKGAAQEAATQGLGPFNVAMANLNKTSSDAGNTILPMLTKFVTELTGLIDKVDAFAQAHPKMTAGILEIVGGLGLLLLALSPVLIAAGSFLIIVETFNTLSDIGLFSSLTSGAKGLWTVLTTDLTPAFSALWVYITETVIPMIVGFAATIWTTVIPAMTTWALETLAVMWPYLLVAAVILGVVVLVVLYHKQIMDAIGAAWDWIKKSVKDATDWIENLFKSWGTDITTWWNNLWNGMTDFLGGIVTKIEGYVTSIISALSKLPSGLISGAGGLLGSAASAASGAVGSVLSAIHVNDAIITPSGQLIQTDAADYILATKNPGALAGGGSGGGITINILGGNYPDSQGASMIAAALATQIQRQIRLKNYA